MMRPSVVSLAIACLVAASPALAAPGKISGSKHDLSVSGPGPYRAESEQSACVFCHVTHRSMGNRTNRPDPGAGHVPYESSTMEGRAGAPTGASRICLSCHDGTIAVGQTRTERIRMAGGDGPIAPGRPSNLGTDLRGTHPISLRSPPSDRVHDPLSGDTVKLDRAGQVQCTSCHDPHDQWGDPVVGKFLVKPSQRSALCGACHSPGGATGAASSHATSGATWRGRVAGQAETVAEGGCAVCHVSHGAGAGQRLLRADLTGDALCLSCHETATDRPLAGDTRKAWSHGETSPGAHDAAEGPGASANHQLPERSPGAPRHVGCVDCHDPHASNPAPAVAPGAAGALAGVAGVTLDGEPVRPARFEYEVCLKCHGPSANKPQALRAASEPVQRAQDDLDLSRVFSPSAVSSHPVAAPGRNASVPGLRGGLSAASQILCTDCHASESGVAAGGRGARGPHGSTYPHLLERQYLTADFTAESGAAYALCYKCHERTELLSDRSTFPLHKLHVVDRQAPCSACHDGHGISAETGSVAGNAHLISFDLAIVRATPAGPPAYTASGGGHGSCALSCHGIPHGPTTKAFSY